MKLLGALHGGGPKIMSELGEELGVTARNVTALVDGLEGEGLVRRVPHATDRRATVIELTPAGAGYGRQMAAGGLLEAIAELFRGLTPDERRQLLGLVGKLHALLGGVRRARAGAGSPSSRGTPHENKNLGRISLLSRTEAGNFFFILPSYCSRWYAGTRIPV
jgi:DNA-binding MarR family transcriptional regulator